MVGDLVEISAHEGSQYKILAASAGPDQPAIEPTIAQRVLMAKRIQEFAQAAKMAFRWATGTKNSAPPAPAVDASDALEADLASLAPGGNIYAAAINSAIAGGTPMGEVTVLVAPSTGGKTKIEVKPGETLLDAARRTLEEQKAK